MVNALVPLDLTADNQIERDSYLVTEHRGTEASEADRRVAEKIIRNCGLERSLVITSGDSALFECLLSLGVDVQGVFSSHEQASRCRVRFPERFSQGSVLSLPFKDEYFDTVICIGVLGDLTADQVPAALGEIYRISKRNVFFKLLPLRTQDVDRQVTAEGRRCWWERKFFESGFRRHPAFFRVNAYEALSQNGEEVALLLEKPTAKPFSEYPIKQSIDMHGAHMDMGCEPGGQSEAYGFRYYWASGYIKPGDRVLDVFCGSGYGSHLLASLTRAAKVTGVDENSCLIDYARINFSDSSKLLGYDMGILLETLSSYPDCSFESIVFFGALERVVAILPEIKRLLVPGGRFIGGAPCQHSVQKESETSVEWVEFKSKLSSAFILEEGYLQSASLHKTVVDESQKKTTRGLFGEVYSLDAQKWMLVSVMKSPLEADFTYSERVFSNAFSTQHLSVLYAQYFIYPCLMHAMVNSEFRLKSSTELVNLAQSVLAKCPVSSNDYKAALCVLAYKKLKDSDGSVTQVLEAIESAVCGEITDPMSLRWRVSLLYVKGKLLAACGEFSGAKQAFSECCSIDARKFGVHLATKTTEAAYLAGRISCSLGLLAEAKKFWEVGVAIGNELLDVKLSDILINVEAPNLFNHGDGVREYAVAWDNISRCTNGLHLLRSECPFDYTLLDNCHQTEYSGVTADVISAREILIERTDELVALRGVLIERTDELVETRRVVAERTKMLECANDELAQLKRELDSRTAGLLDGQTVIAERTKILERTLDDLAQVQQELIERTNELTETRAVVSERSKMLESTCGDLTMVQRELSERTEELVETRVVVAERTEALEGACDDLAQVRRALIERTKELVDARAVVVERTEMLESVCDDLAQVQRELIDRTEELVGTRAVVVERTEMLESACDSLAQVQRELTEPGKELQSDFPRSLYKRFLRKIKK
ncbi:MAG: methyltransferase domain-containing protein [Pseudomonas sp.]|uniref:class I SAM-dependent methyltransferase n=1 Tax=Pseudomonas sp. TaxID=306 RepID=UPI003D0FA4D1